MHIEGGPFCCKMKFRSSLHFFLLTALPTERLFEQAQNWHQCNTVSAGIANMPEDPPA